MKSTVFSVDLVVEPNNCHVFFFRRGSRSGVGLYTRSQDQLIKLHQWLESHTNVKQTVTISTKIPGRTNIVFM